MANRSRSRPRSRGAPRPTTWDQPIFDFNQAAMGPITTVLDLSNPKIIAGETSSGTIVRCRGEVEIMNGSNSNTEFEVSIGIVVVTAEALAAVILPNPRGSQSNDWYYWTQKTAHMLGNNTGEGDPTWRWQFDLRSMRKLREGYRLACVVVKDDSTQLSVNHITFRNLWKLNA